MNGSVWQLRQGACIWIVVFAVEVLLFIFYKPNAECGRLRYFWLFIIKPSRMQGIAESKIEYAHGKDVFLQADAQLYRAKQNGRNQVCCE